LSGAGFRQSERKLGSRRVRPEEKLLFAQERWDEHWIGWTHNERELFNGTRRQKSQTPESSEDSSTTQHSSVNSSNPGNGQRMEVVAPGDNITPLLPLPGAMTLLSPPEFLQRSSHTHPNDLVMTTQGAVRSVGDMQSTAEGPRSSSPRLRMNTYREEHPRLSIEVRVGEMDRFLAHQDEDFDDDPAPVAEEWRKLRSLIPKALRLRSQLENKRWDLHAKQLRKSSADEAFMKYIRESRVTPVADSSSHSIMTDGHEIEGLYTAMQETRDAYGECEYEYDILEESLNETEFELAKTERRLRRTKAHEMPDDKNAESAQERSGSVASSNPDSLLGISSEFAEHYHPLEAEYLSRLGDLDLAREQRDNMVLERDKLLSRQDSRQYLGVDLQDEEKQFLLEFTKDEATMRTEIAQIEADVERIKAECLAQGLDITASSSESEYESEKESNSLNSSHREGKFEVEGTETIRSPTSESSYSTFSLILPSPLEGKAALGVLITEFDEDNKGDRISRWMLHKLRTSPIEVELFVRVFLKLAHHFTLQQLKMDIVRFQQNVLSLWGEDKANKPPEAFRDVPTPSADSSVVLKGRGQEDNMASAKSPRSGDSKKG
jgi:hypothetical protein